MRRKTANWRQIARNGHENYEKPWRNGVISKEEIRQLNDANNNNVENVVLPDFNGNKLSSMGPSNSHVESPLGFVNRSAASCSQPASHKLGTMNGEESKTSAKYMGGSKDEEKKHRHSGKKSRDREREKDSRGDRRSRSKSRGRSSEARKVKVGENPNNIPWRLIEIDPESLPKPFDRHVKLNWMRDEYKRKRDRLSAKIIELFGKDSDEDKGYEELPSAARIPKRKRRTADSDSSTEKSNVTADDNDNEFNEQTADRRSPIFLSRKSRRKRKRNPREGTVISAKKKSSKGYSTPSYVSSTESSSQTHENKGDSTASTSDVPTDSEDLNYQPSKPLFGIPSRDPSWRIIFRRSQKIDRNESSATNTSSNDIHDPEESLSQDEASPGSASTTELRGRKEVDENERNPGFNSDFSFTGAAAAAASNIKSVAASREHSVIRNKSHAIHLRKKVSDCIKDAVNEESAPNDGPTTEEVPTGSSSGDPLLNCIDPKVEKIFAGLSNSSPSRSQQISEGTANPSSTTEIESSNRLLAALDQIFLYLLNRRRLEEREKSASKLAIQRNRQLELLKARREFQSGLKIFRQEFLLILETLSTLELVLCFISRGLDNRTPIGVKRFTQAEVRSAMREAGIDDKSGDVKVKPSGNEEGLLLVERTILTIDLTREESVKQDMCDSSTDPPLKKRRDQVVNVLTKIEPNEANEDCSTSEEPAEVTHDLNANEIPLTVPSIAEVMTISRQQFETIGEKSSSLTQEEDPCLMCSLASRVACARCFKANYCSKKCQEIHWVENHHVTCVPQQVIILK